MNVHPISKSRVLALVFLLLLPFLLAACWTSKATLRKQATRHPTMTIGYWGHGWEARPFHERIAPAPAGLIEKIRIENRIDDFLVATQSRHVI